MKARMEGFQKPATAPTKKVGLAVVSYHGAKAACSCGWTYTHIREKVREDAIDRHLARKHQGRGIRL